MLHREPAAKYHKLSGVPDKLRFRKLRIERSHSSGYGVDQDLGGPSSDDIIDGVLAQMTQDVSWPKASEGGKIVGKEEIRAYWTRQWSEFDPHVEPVAIAEESEGKVRARVHQLVKSLEGDVLSDSEVLHVFTMSGGLIAAIFLGDEGDQTASPSAAFAHRS